MKLPFVSGLLSLGGLEARDPWLALFALLCVPVYLLSRGAGGRVLFSSLRILPRESAARSWRARLAPLPPLLLSGAAALFGLALCGPRIPDQQSRVRRQGIAIMMVVDASGSMAALDLSEGERERTRLQAVKEVFVDFVRGGKGLRGRPDDLIGIVSFAGFADTRCPLTLDHDNLARIAAGLEIAKNPEEDGTALGDGLGLALERLRESPARSKVAILLTDGVNNRGETAPLQAADLARTVGVKVYTVGAGTTGMAPVRVQDPFGGSVLQRVPVEIDEAVLREIAARTGGRYFRAGDADSLRRVYQEIDALERTELIEDRFQRYREFYPHLVGAGLALLCLGWLLSATVLRRLPA